MLLRASIALVLVLTFADVPSRAATAVQTQAVSVEELARTKAEGLRLLGSREYARAVDLFVTLLQRREQRHGLDDERVAMAAFNLGRALREAKRPAEAVAPLRNAVRIAALRHGEGDRRGRRVLTRTQCTHVLPLGQGVTASGPAAAVRGLGDRETAWSFRRC